MAPADTSVRYRSGTGTPLVLLHGWNGSIESWKQVMDMLETDSPVLRYDQQVDQPDDRGGFDAWIEELDRIMADHSITRPVLVGHSMGGMIALSYAAARSHYSGLVIIGSCADTPEPRQRSPSFFLEQLDRMDRTRWAEMIADNYLPDGGDPEQRTAVIDELVTAPEARLRGGLAAMVQYDVRDALVDVDVPAVVVGGRQDAAITPGKVRETADLLDAPVRMVDSSHLLLQDAPDAVAAAIREVVDRV